MSNHGEPKYVSGDYPPEKIRKTRKQRRTVSICKPTDSEATAQLRARIAQLEDRIKKLEAGGVLPYSHLAGKIAGLKEALAIIEGDRG